MLNYLLLDDKCSDCQFVSNAFTLLRIPVQTIFVAETSLPTTDHPSNAVYLLCKQSATHHAHIFHQAGEKDQPLYIVVGETAPSVKSTSHAIQHLQMPFCKHELKAALSNCYDHFYQSYHAFPLAQQFPVGLSKLVGQSDAIMHVKRMIQQVATIDATVLIQGESGTGKDVIANCIHQLSPRQKHPFVPINCGAIPGELMESELFGYEKGAFTGAAARRIGRFEMAQSGTLFLDEIGEMPFPMQVKLLRVLQERKIERVGGNQSVDVNIRIVAATNKQLEDHIRDNKFREDLYYRLNVFPINVPALRERQSDIPLLIDYYIEQVYQRIQHKVHFTEAAIALLMDYQWPGNIRELQNFVERMVILHPDGMINDVTLRNFIHCSLNKTPSKSESLLS